MKRLPVVEFSILVLVLVTTACGSTPSPFEPGATLSAEATPTVTIQSKASGVEETQLIQLDNCDGKANLTRTEQRSQTIDAEISAEVAAQIGASAQVIYGDVQAAVGMALAAGNARGTSIELAAPPGTRMEFQLIWIGDEEIGVVQKILNSEIPIAFRSFSASDVRIKSQYDLGCPTTTPPVGTEAASDGSNQVGPEPTIAATSPGRVDCGQLIIGDPHPPSLGTSWDFAASNEDRIIHVWSNHWDPNLPEYKLLLPAGQTISFMSGGGSYWSDRPGCSGVAQELYKRDGFREITIEQYRMYIEQSAIP